MIGRNVTAWLLMVSAAAFPVRGATPPPRSLSVAARYVVADSFLASRKVRQAAKAAPAAFSDDGMGLIYHRVIGVRGIFYRDLESGRERMLVTDAALARHLSSALKRTVAPDTIDATGLGYDAEHNVLRFEHDGPWTLMANGTLARPPKDGDASDALSPDGRLRIEANGYDLAAVDVRTGRRIALTTDGTREQPYGRGLATLPDILREGTEEPKMPVSVRWSPDSRRILTWRLDTRGAEPLSITQANPPGKLLPRSFRYLYPLAGAARLPTMQRLLIDVGAAFASGVAHVTPLAIPPEAMLYPADPDLGWVGSRGRAQWTKRGYGELDVYDIDPANGAVRVVAREAVKPLVTVTSTALQPAPELGGELVISERSGWAQLYLVRPDDPDGGVPLTQGAWEVLSVEHVDAAAKAVLVTGVGRERDRDRYAQSFYRVPLDGRAPTLLTPEPLDHQVTVSPDGRWFIDRMSSPIVPTRTVVRSTQDGRIVADLGRVDARPLSAAGFTAPEPFAGVAADGHTPLHGMIFRPAHFDPSRHYPVIDDVYTGPTTTQVPTSWSGTVLSEANSVAQLGAIVVMIDGRGTSRRGQAFRLPAFQNLGEVGIDDHIAMIRQMATRYPYMDVERTGVFGCSAGGYDAARFILRRSEFFKVAVASSGNHDLRLDKAWWPEVSMGDASPEVWERNSNTSVAAQLRGKLLLIHGDIDSNVPVTATQRLAKAIVDAGRTVDVVIQPNAEHCDWTPFYWRQFRDYFVRNLLNEAPPGDARIATPAAAAHP